MPITTVDTGAEEILKAFFADTGKSALKLRLFTDNETITSATVLADLTEAAGGGYAAIDLAPADATVSTVNGIPQVAFPAKTFTFTGALTGGASIYGHYVTNNAGTILIYVQKESTTYTPAQNGDSVTITPVFQLSAGTPA